jgi:hypothetical protein
MALVNCTECGAQISDAASVCPRCGCPADKPVQPATTSDKKTASGWATVVFLVICVVGAIAMFDSSGDKDQAKKSVASITTDDTKPLPDCLLSNITLPEITATTIDDERAICKEISLTQGKPPSSHFLVQVATVIFVFRANGYDLPPKDIAYQLMNIIEARGQTNASEDVKFKTVETVMKMYVGWNGHITPQDVNTFLRNSGDEAHRLSDDGLTAMMASVLAAKKDAGEN